MIVLGFACRGELNSINIDEALLSSGRRRKLSRIKNTGSRELAICAEIALIRALCGYTGRKVTLPLQIEEKEKGKLYFDADSPYAELFFSLSHAGNLAVAAVSDHELGIDIEEMTRNIPSATNKILHPDNLKIFNSLNNDAARQEYFFEYWTCMESYMKLTGEGLFLKTTKIKISAEGEASSAEHKTRGYIHSCTHLVPEGAGKYKCNLCTEVPEEEITVSSCAHFL